MARAKAAGKIIGGRRKGWVYHDKILDPVRETLRKQLADGMKQKALAALYSVSAAKLSIYIRKHQLIPGKVYPGPRPKKPVEDAAPDVPRPDNVDDAAIEAQEAKTERKVPIVTEKNPTATASRADMTSALRASEEEAPEDEIDTSEMEGDDPEEE